MKKNEEQSVLLRRRFRRRRAIITAPSHFTRAQRAGERRSGSREREISLSNGDAASLFFPNEEPFFPRGGCARSLPHALLLLKVNGTIEKKENKDVLKQTHT